MLRFIAELFINPLSHFFIVLALGGLLYFWGRTQPAKYLGIYAGSWLLITSASPLPGFLVEKRESRFSIAELEKSQSTAASLQILILGAGHSNAPDKHIHDRLSEPAIKRLLEGLRQKKTFPSAKLICSGFTDFGDQSQAEAMAEMALVLGVPESDTLLQPLAINTEDEAKTYVQRFGTEHTLILVTSALHMPRAMFWFRHFGVEPIPAPTDHLVKRSPEQSDQFSWWPRLHKLRMTQKLLHEYAGMLHAKWKTCSK